MPVTITDAGIAIPRLPRPQDPDADSIEALSNDCHESDSGRFCEGAGLSSADFTYDTKESRFGTTHRMWVDHEGEHAEAHWQVKPKIVQVSWIGISSGLQRRGLGQTMLSAIQARHPEHTLRLTEPNEKSKGMFEKWKKLTASADDEDDARPPPAAGFSNQQRKADLVARINAASFLTDFANPCQHAPYPEGRSCSGDHGKGGTTLLDRPKRKTKAKVEPAGAAKYKDDPEAVFQAIPADKYEGQEYLEALATPPEQIKPSSQGEDMLLKQVRHVQGFDALPQVVDQKAFDAIPGVPFYRGLGGPKDSAFSEAYRSGDHYAGIGIYGNGDYFTTSGNTAKKYAFGYPRPGVVQAKLRPGARTIEFEDIADMHDAVRERKVHPLRDGPVVTNGLMKQDRRYRDMGVYAASLGYDAIVVETPARVIGNERYYVILNRGATVVSEEDLK